MGEADGEGFWCSRLCIEVGEGRTVLMGRAGLEGRIDLMGRWGGRSLCRGDVSVFSIGEEARRP